MNKNPFSIYDFLGYLFPGLIFLVTVFFVCHVTSVPLQEYFDFSKYQDLLKKGKEYDWWESTVFVIVASYVVGHIVAYLSSSTVEYFTNHLFGYPSHYLLHEDSINYCNVFSRYFSEHTFGSIVWRIFVMLVLLPVTLVMFVFGIKFSLITFIVRPLDEYVRNSILQKLNKLSEILSLQQPDVNSNADYHRIVMHYVYLNIESCQRKVDNYVAMYGFLRAMALIACLLFDYLLIDQIQYSYHIVRALGIEKCVINWKCIIILVVILIVANLLYMGFVKFYRRFTLENYMALLTDKAMQVNQS